MTLYLLQMIFSLSVSLMQNGILAIDARPFRTQSRPGASRRADPGQKVRARDGQMA
jgi:hypothetical protein